MNEDGQKEKQDKVLNYDRLSCPREANQVKLQSLRLVLSGRLCHLADSGRLLERLKVDNGVLYFPALILKLEGPAYDLWLF